MNKSENIEKVSVLSFHTSGKITEKTNNRKIRRNKIVERMEKMLRNTRLTDITIGNSLRILHHVLTIAILIPILFANKYIVWVIFLINILVGLCFIINDNSCILTILENKFLKDNYNYLNFFLELLGFEKTKRNYTIAQFCWTISAVSVVSIIYYIRFLRAAN